MSLKVNLWNSDLVVTDAQRDRLVDYILAHLSRCPDERQSVSYLVECVRMDTRIRFPTRNNDAVSMFEALGFKIEQSANGRTSYVTL